MWQKVSSTGALLRASAVAAETVSPPERALLFERLGALYDIRGEHGKAEDMVRRALELHQAQGERRGMARQFHNLGALHALRGEKESALSYHRRAREIAEDFDTREGVAMAYGSGGLVYAVQGTRQGDEKIHRRSLEASHRLGRRRDAAHAYANLGLIYCKKEYLMLAQAYWEKARDLYRQIDCEDQAARMQGWIDRMPTPEQRTPDREASNRESPVPSVA